MNSTPHQRRLSELLPSVVSLARKAGEEIMAVYIGTEIEVGYKDDLSPLTQADLASHHVIVQGLTHLTPEWPVLSEESEEIPYQQRSAWEYFWLVDPLDGTKEFLRRNGEFTVNIALIHRGTPILGVVYAPAIDTMYFAAGGVGAFRTSGGESVRIHAGTTSHGTIRVVASRSHAGNGSLDRFCGGLSGYELVVMGSSLKFCLVAEGSADVYPRTGPTMEWDTAAAHCIVQEAGGSVLDLEGNPLLYNKPILINPGFVTRCNPVRT